MTPSPEPGKPLSETELKKKPSDRILEIYKSLPAYYTQCFAKAIVDYLDEERDTKITHQAAQIRAYGEALEAFADGRIYGPWTEFAKDVLKQYPLSGSEEGGEERK